MKVAGREAGKYCVVLKKMDNTFVLVTGPKTLTGIKRRRCNVEHLEPTQHLLKIDTDAPDELVIKAYDAIGLTKKLSLRLPSPEVMKEFEKKAKEIPKVEKPKEEKKAEKKPEKEEKKPEVKPEVKIEKKEEKPKEKKGITLKFKIPSLRRKKPEEEKKVEKKPEKKVEKKAKKKK
jgi:large subunit ribosomal protein L14e